MASSQRNGGEMVLAEMREFASFEAKTQRYIRRSLDVAFSDDTVIELYARDIGETAEIRAQSKVYEKLADVRQASPVSSDFDEIETFMGKLISVSGFDLSQGRLPTFSSYRFLYERLLGAGTRPWLPGAFCAASALPNLHPDMRRNLLQSISEAAATSPGWSNKEPVFYPEWVEKVEKTN